MWLSLRSVKSNNVDFLCRRPINIPQDSEDIEFWPENLLHNIKELIYYIITFTSLCQIFTMQELVQLTWVSSRSFSVTCTQFLVLGGPGGTVCDSLFSGEVNVIIFFENIITFSRYTPSSHLQIDLKSFPRSAFVFMNTSSARFISC